MRTVRRVGNRIAVTLLAVLWMLCISASADSGDNSLYDLGLENAVSCSPEFYYSTLEYDVVVPAGTTELQLNPVTSNSEASVIDISGTEIAEDGTTTVYITTEAPNGARVSYTLHVTSEAPVETEPPQTEKSQEQIQQEEAQRQSESEAEAKREAELAANRRQIETLSVQNADLSDRLNLLMKVLYGLVAFAVLLLIIIINQSFRNKDLKEDLKEARGQIEKSNEFARKEQVMQGGFYYNVPREIAPDAAQGMPPIPPVQEATQNVQAAFGNASQVLQAQPAPGQVNAPAQPESGLPQPEVPQPTSSRRRAKKEASAPAPEPELVQGETQEPDVNVEMIDL